MPSMNGNSEGFDFGQWANADQNSLSGIISRESNRANYGALMSDKRMGEVRKMLFRMVQRWDEHDIRAIIANYGDASLVRAHMSKDKLCKQAVETIIINMDPDELEALAKKTKYRVAGLKNDIKKNDKAADRRGKSALLDMMKQFEAIKDAKNYQDYAKKLRKSEGINPGKVLRGHYYTLTRELKELLKTYDDLAIRALAADLGIEVDEKDKLKRSDLTRQIINLVCLYVDIITGKNKNLHYGNAITRPQVIQELLKYTSYGFLSGSPGITPAEGRILREEARRNKMIIAMRLKLMKSRSSTGSKEFKSLTGFGQTMLPHNAVKVLRDNDKGVLRDCSMEELLNLAVNYGVNPGTRDVGKLKLEIYRAMAAEQKMIKSAQRELNFNKKRPTVARYDKFEALQQMHIDNTKYTVHPSLKKDRLTITSVLADIKDGADRVTGKYKQVEYIAGQVLTYFMSLKNVFSEGNKANMMAQAFTEAMYRQSKSEEYKPKPPKENGSITQTIAYMHLVLKIQFKCITEALRYKDDTGEHVIDPINNPMSVFERVSDDIDGVYKLKFPFAIYLAYIYLIASGQNSSAEYLRSEYGMRRKTFKELIRVRDRVHNAAARAGRFILNTTIGNIGRGIKNIVAFVANAEKTYKTRGSLNEDDRDFLGELESQTVGGLKEVCTRKLRVDLATNSAEEEKKGQVEKEAARDKAGQSFDTLTQGFPDILKKEILIYIIAKMMKRKAICSYLEYVSLNTESLPNWTDIKSWIEAVIKKARGKFINKVKNLQFKGLKDRFRRFGMGGRTGGGARSARSLTKGVSDSEDVINLGSEDSDDASDSGNNGVESIFSMISIANLTIGSIDITDGVTNFFSIFNDDSVSIGASNIFSMFDDNYTYISSFQNMLDIFSEVSTIEQITNFFSIFNDESIIVGARNIFSMFNNDSTYISSFQNMLDIFSVDMMSKQDISLISMGLSNFFAIFSGYTGQMINDIGNGYFNFFSIFTQIDKSKTDFISTGIYNMMYSYSLYTDEQLMDISVGRYNFFNIFNNISEENLSTMSVGIYNILKSYSIYDESNLSSISIGRLNLYSSFTDQTVISGFKNFFTMFSNNTQYNLVTDVHAILELLTNSRSGHGDDEDGHRHRGFVGPESKKHQFRQEDAALKKIGEEISARTKELEDKGMSPEAIAKDKKLIRLKEKQSSSETTLNAAKNMYDSDRKHTNFNHGIEATEYLSTDAKALRFTRVRKALADPVFIVNRSTNGDEIKLLENILDAVKNSGDGTLSYLQMAVPMLALSNAGPFTPGAAAAISGLTALSTVDAVVSTATALSGLTDDLKSTSGYARGSNRIKATRNKLLKSLPAFASGTNKFTTGAYQNYLNQATKQVSNISSLGKTMDSTSFISGDSLQGGGNPELVNIDWTNKTASVKPIPEDTKFKRLSSGTMSQYERELPMSVSIKNNLVKYANVSFPSNITDDGSEMAVKTYQINNPMTEPININGKDTTIFGLISIIAETLISISGSVEAGNQIQQAIAANTAAQASSGGASDIEESSGSFTSSFNDILQGM